MIVPLPELQFWMNCSLNRECSCFAVLILNRVALTFGFKVKLLVVFELMESNLNCLWSPSRVHFIRDSLRRWGKVLIFIDRFRSDL